MSWNVTIPTTAKADFVKVVEAAPYTTDDAPATVTEEKAIAAAKKAVLALFRANAIAKASHYSASMGGHDNAVSVAVHAYP